MSGVRLCPADAVPEGGGRGFRLGTGTDQQAVFIVRKSGTLHAYRNACPHTGAPLDWVPDRFFDETGTFLLCGTHGARFRVADGRCVAGPCLGRALAPVPIRIAAAEIVLLCDAAPLR